MNTRLGWRLFGCRKIDRIIQLHEWGGAKVQLKRNSLPRCRDHANSMAQNMSMECQIVANRLQILSGPCNTKETSACSFIQLMERFRGRVPALQRRGNCDRRGSWASNEQACYAARRRAETASGQLLQSGENLSARATRAGA
jgi:hypothetical protein